MSDRRVPRRQPNGPPPAVKEGSPGIPVAAPVAATAVVVPDVAEIAAEILGGTAATVKDALSAGRLDDILVELHDQESDGKSRKTVIAALEARIEELEA